MIGFFDYTVVLTYLSLLSAFCGIVSVALGAGPFPAVFLLMFCGLCDAFDGRMARDKETRTKEEKIHGIQLDALADMVAFGIFPGVIGVGMLENMKVSTMSHTGAVLALLAAAGFYAAAALTRLAFFNMTELALQEKQIARTEYIGLPVTASALLFPPLAVLFSLFGGTPAVFYSYLVLLVGTGILFILRIRIPKPGTRGILLGILIGVLEVLSYLIFR